MLILHAAQSRPFSFRWDLLRRLLVELPASDHVAFSMICHDKKESTELLFPVAQFYRSKLGDWTATSHRPEWALLEKRYPQGPNQRCFLFRLKPSRLQTILIPSNWHPGLSARSFLKASFSYEANEMNGDETDASQRDEHTSAVEVRSRCVASCGLSSASMIGSRVTSHSWSSKLGACTSRGVWIVIQ